MKRILIIKLWALGDLLMATPLLKALHQKFPDVKITWVADTYYGRILENHPLIADLILVDTGSWRRKLRHGKVVAWFRQALSLNLEMRRRQFDIAINCHPEKWWMRILAVAPIRVGLFDSAKLPLTRKLYTHPLARPHGMPMHSTDYYLQAMAALGLSGPFDRHMRLPVSDDDQQQSIVFLQNEPGYRQDWPLVVLHPGTSQTSKCWPTDYFAEVAAALLPENNVVLTGSTRELPLASAILAALPSEGPKPMVAIGKLENIGATAALAQKASAVVSGDTSMLHMASALETPLIGIFGSTRPSGNKPLYGPQALLYDDTVSCAPCYRANCPLKGSQYLQCQRAVTPQQVLEALNQLSKEKIA